MKRKSIWVLVLALVGVAVYAGNVLATGSQGFHGTTLATATFGRISSHVQTQDGDDPTCTPHVYSANGANSFVDIGGGAVHLIRDESGAVARTVVVQLIPAGATRRQDAPDPGNCQF